MATFTGGEEIVDVVSIGGVSVGMYIVPAGQYAKLGYINSRYSLNNMSITFADLTSSFYGPLDGTVIWPLWINEGDLFNIGTGGGFTDEWHGTILLYNKP